MAIAEVKKIGLIGLKRDQGAVIDALYDFSQLQIIGVNQEGALSNDAISELDYRLAQLKFALEFVERYAEPEKISLKQKLEKMASRGLHVSKKKIDQLVTDFDYKKVIAEAERLEENINNKQTLVTNIQSEINELEPWVDLKFNYQEKATDKASASIGTISDLGYAGLIKDFEDKKVPCEVQIIGQKEKEVKVLVVYLNQVSVQVREILSQNDFREVLLPEITAAPQTAIAEKKKAIDQLNAEIDKLTQAAKNLSLHRENLQILFDYTTWQRDKTAASFQALSQDKTFYITGYVAKDRLSELEKRIGKVTSDYYISELPIEKDEDLPVILRNNRSIFPFETVTNVYGAPKPNEIDPTPFLAPFFILFFGICLSDAGYGLLLGGMAFLAIKIFKLPPNKQGFFRLFVYAGIVTFIIGALFGGWFGVALEDLPDSAIKSALLSVKIIDPVTNPLTMLVFSMILGVIQVVTGIVVNFYYQIKQKDWGKAFDAGAWIFLLLGVIFWLVAGQVVKNAGLQQIGQYWIYAGVAVLVLTQGRRQKSIIMKIPAGILSLYDLVGYFSDVMSYSRLLALGLSTGIIAFVINMVAMLFKDMIPFIGWPVAIGILIGGHLFNLAINALGSFIHSGRLQYVEFFPKFMEGGGSRFQPLAKQAKYVNIDKEDN